MTGLRSTTAWIVYRRLIATLPLIYRRAVPISSRLKPNSLQRRRLLRIAKHHFHNKVTKKQLFMSFLKAKLPKICELANQNVRIVFPISKIQVARYTCIPFLGGMVGIFA